ncbi:MAG: hypothetical protein ABI600_09025 [Luteolibacter sp.]
MIFIRVECDSVDGGIELGLGVAQGIAAGVVSSLALLEPRATLWKAYPGLRLCTW